MHAHYEEVFYGTDLITTFYLGSWNNVHVVALPIYLSIWAIIGLKFDTNDTYSFQKTEFPLIIRLNMGNVADIWWI